MGIIILYSRRQNGDVFVPFCPVEMEIKRLFPYTRMETGRAEADATECALQLTITIVASMKMMPQAPKKAKRSIALSKRLHLEAIRVNWQREIDCQ